MALESGGALDSDGSSDGAEDAEPRDIRELAEALEDRFFCCRCGGRGGIAKEVAMTGAGLSKLLDVQHHHYLFVSCEHCGNVEIYDPEVLLGRKPGKLGTALDLLFGG